jgi:hypothetical protein
MLPSEAMRLEEAIRFTVLRLYFAELDRERS